MSNAFQEFFTLLIPFYDNNSYQRPAEYQSVKIGLKYQKRTKIFSTPRKILVPYQLKLIKTMITSHDFH